MRRLLLFIAALAFTGCASPATMSEEAAPHADDALASLGGLHRYLAASGGQIASTYRIAHPEQTYPGIVRASGFAFANGGRCTILTYADANEARQLAPRSEGKRTGRFKQGGNFMSNETPERRQQYVPTLQFGPHVAVCDRADSHVKPALRALAAHAETGDQATP